MQPAQKEPWMDKAVTETDCNNIVFLENLLDSQFFSKVIFFLLVTFDKLWCLVDILVWHEAVILSFTSNFSCAIANKDWH